MLEKLKGVNMFLDKFSQPMRQTATASKKSTFSQKMWLFLFFFSLAWLISTIFLPKKEIVPEKTKESAEIVKVDISNIPSKIIGNENISLKVQGLRIKDITLKKYDTERNSDKKITLLSDKEDFTELGFLSANGNTPAPNSVWRIIESEPNSIKMIWQNPNGIIFNRTVSVSDNYLISISDKIENKSGRDFNFSQYGRISKKVSDSASSRIGVFQGAIADVNTSIEKEDFAKLEKKSFAFDTNRGFIGFTEQYWETILKLDLENQTMRMKSRSENLFQVDSQTEIINLTSGSAVEISSQMFAGPKSQKLLSELASQGFTGLGSTIDYGWFFFLSKPFLWALIGLLGIVGNFGIAIIILTIIIRILMYPLTRKSFESMANMKKLQPEIQKIQRLYPNDRAKQQQEMMALYQRLKVNPMSGCLPMLLQIPIFFALYKALVISVHMRQANFLWIPDLSVADPTSLFNLFGLLPYSIPSWLPAMGLLPVLMGITMWWQQKIQSGNTAKDKTPGMGVMKWMPFIFVLLFASLPAGLVLYWTVSNLLAILQLYYMDKKAQKRL